MRDPIVSAVVASRLGLLLSEPAIGQALAQFPPVLSPGLRQGIDIIEGQLLFDREYIKSLTPDELKARLIDAMKQLDQKHTPTFEDSGYNFAI